VDPCCTLHARRLWHSVNKAANRQKTLSVRNKVCRNLADDPYFPVHGKKPFFVAFSTKAVQCTPTPLVCYCRLLEITLGAVSVPISSLSPYFSAFLLLCALNPAREYGEHCKLFKQLARTELGRQNILGAFRQWNYPPFLTYKLAQFCFTLWIVRINQIASVDVQNWAYLLNVFFLGGGRCHYRPHDLEALLPFNAETHNWYKPTMSVGRQCQLVCLRWTLHLKWDSRWKWESHGKPTDMRIRLQLKNGMGRSRNERRWEWEWPLFLCKKNSTDFYWWRLSLGCRLILYLLVFGIFILKDDCRHFCFIFKVLWKVF